MGETKTIICDLDGVLFRHHGSLRAQITDEVEILPGVLESLEEWYKRGYKLIILTGRPEGTRAKTEYQLRCAGIAYSQLVMDVGRFPRVLINDSKPDSDMETAIGITITRNEGLLDIQKRIDKG